MKEQLANIKIFQTFAQMPKEKRLKIILIVGIIAIAGIFLSESFSAKSKTDSVQENSEKEQRLREYETLTEQKLQKILALIDGIGNCRVMLTLESSEQSVYSSDLESQTQEGGDSSSSSQKNQYVIVDDNGQKPVLEKEIEPKIRGVIVVCEGADDVYVRSAVIDSVRAALGISGANISVVRGGKNG
ncbi:MAG: hypothetical protein IJG23_03325 [Clostridia bacterium]|nr:hypothetical protein [Clostridia bacterium]